MNVIGQCICWNNCVICQIQCLQTYYDMKDQLIKGIYILEQYYKMIPSFQLHVNSSSTGKGKYSRYKKNHKDSFLVFFFKFLSKSEMSEVVISQSMDKWTTPKDSKTETMSTTVQQQQQEQQQEITVQDQRQISSTGHHLWETYIQSCCN